MHVGIGQWFGYVDLFVAEINWSDTVLILTYIIT